uniref:Uncharacterized protein n=1 Tax=Eutreptiella gymnastica TaxID=73025 RepID=A0A6U8FUH1_9EUGL|mmetsp:Transcript_44794/g.80274  ORF Transcript_44794/g.80274 Transcript_44794/m.80274 type:complete len:136 (+) Transcript_44794:110-517(+)
MSPCFVHSKLLHFRCQEYEAAEEEGKTKDQEELSRVPDEATEPEKQQAADVASAAAVAKQVKEQEKRRAAGAVAAATAAAVNAAATAAAYQAQEQEKQRAAGAEAAAAAAIQESGPDPDYATIQLSRRRLVLLCC